MRAKISRRLVIDASVARAAGGEKAVYPASKHCRDFLQRTLDVCHRAVLTPSVRAEWKKHESAFARTWRVAMMARKKLLFINAPEDAALRDAIEDAAETERGRHAMIKDVHLIEAARATDRTVVSLDDTVRALFGAASRHVRELGSVVWANPDREAEHCSEWLEKGAPSQKHLRIEGFRSPKG